jgi:hypothetical protein
MIETENRIANIAATDATTIAEMQTQLLRLKDEQQSFGNQARTMLSKLDLERLPRLPTSAERWEQSRHTDMAALRAMLAPFETTLPPVLFNGLNKFCAASGSRIIIMCSDTVSSSRATTLSG